jgi:CRISPR/Cas system CMR-associated protein Cmr5 small subunit
LSTDEEEKVRGKMLQYERKIDSLLQEMGGLKTEVALEKSRREVERREEMLATSQLTVEEQERQLKDYQLDLQAAELENRRLRQQRAADDLDTGR